MSKNLTSKIDDASQIYDHAQSSVKILIGLSNNIDSLIAAYLLKKQGFQVFGVSIQTWREGKRKKNYDIEGKEIEGQDVELKPPRCYIKDLDKIKKFCETIGIPFYATDIIDEYESKILDTSLTKRLSGLKFQTCFNCNKLKIQTLYSKMKALNCDLIATGHYAKVFKNHSSKEFYVYRSNEVNHDQSNMLVGLSQEILSKLYLPLSDLKREEVLKIAENFQLSGFAQGDNKENRSLCLVNDDNFVSYMMASVPSSLFLTGLIINHETGKGQDEHKGLHNFFDGDKALKLKDSSNDKYDVVDIDESQKVVYVSSEIQEINAFQLFDFEISKDVDRSTPSHYYIKINNKESFHRCFIYYKNNNSCLIELDSPIEEIQGNSLVVVYNDKEGAIRALGKGFVGKKGSFELVNRTKFYNETEETDEDDQKETNFGYF
jgi:tRNA-specific 2-thiouridylase